MKRCKICVMPDTRVGIKFDDDGICMPCKSFMKKSKVNMVKRFSDLKKLADYHRHRTYPYDCAIPLSGGKDSHYQAYIATEILGLNPLGIMIDNSSWTKTGRKNFYNLSDRFDMDIITYTPSVQDLRIATHMNFLVHLHPSRAWDDILYKRPLEIAKALGIKLVIWGEDTSFETGGFNWKETPNALKLIPKFFRQMFRDMDVIFLSYYTDWSRYYNSNMAKKFGFKGLNDTGEWKREGFIDLFHTEQVDTIGYLVNQYCKFIKFGFSSMTELCSDAIRHGKMSREEAIKVVNEEDWKLDPKMLKDFCSYIGITESRFWRVIDKFANKELLEKRDGVWRLKEDAR